MLKYCLFTALLFFSLNRSYSQFVVKDVLAVSPQASIFNPEYNTTLNLVCWESDEGQLWVCGLDPVTRLFNPENGRGTFVTDNLSPAGVENMNGPEWMLSTQGTQIVYNKNICGIQYPGISTKVLGGWTSTTLFQYPHAIYSMASSNYADTVARFLFETYDDRGIYWVKNTDLNTRYHYPEVTLGFFARDNQQICCATNKSRYPGFIETTCSLPYFTSISNDTIGAPFMWYDPASNSRLFMYRTNGFKTLKIMQEISQDFWVLYKQFDSPLPEPYIYITSPEPFTCGGQSYISFMAAQSGAGREGLPAEIWIASADPADSLMRRVSDTTVAIRTDPEPVVFADSAFIYYTDIIVNDQAMVQYSVRKCDTGLANIITTQKTQNLSSPAISVFPNPNNGRFTLQTNKAFASGSKIFVFDMAGRQVFYTITEGYRPELNLGNLPAGNYSLKIVNQNEEAYVLFTIND